MTEQVEVAQTPAQPEKPMITITGKQLGMIKRQFLANLTAQYQSFIQFLVHTHADQDIKEESIEFFDRGYLRMQEAIIALKVIQTPQFETPAKKEEAQPVEAVPQAEQKAQEIDVADVPHSEPSNCQ